MDTKKNLVMIVGGYYPNPSPTGKCAEKYISLLKDVYNVDVICIADETDTPFTFKEKRVFPVTTKYYSTQNKLKKRMSQMSWKLSKIPTHVLDRFRSPNNLHWYVKAAYNQLEMINAEKTIDVVFSVGAPTSSHCAALLFKQAHPDIRWVTYTVDSYSAQNGNKKRHRNFEKCLLEKADYNLLSEEIYQNCEFLWEGKPDRFGALPYLMPERRESSTEHKTWFDRTKVNFVYAGSFYRKIRNPEYLLQLFSLSPAKYVLHLFCSGDCDDIIDNAIKQSEGKIIRHSLVSPDEIQDVYDSSDVLVNVGNSIPEFQPSKTFEYISTGKPILNIYQNELIDRVLEKYPNAIQISNNDTFKRAMFTLCEFIKKYDGYSIDTSIINAIYKTNTNDYLRSIITAAFIGAIFSDNRQIPHETMIKEGIVL